MSWLNLPPVGRDQWNAFADANSLLQLLPPLAPRKATVGTPDPTLAYYRYLVAAMLRQTPLEGERAQFCHAAADHLAGPQPEDRIDWPEFTNRYLSIYARCHFGVSGGSWHALPLDHETPFKLLCWFNQTGRLDSGVCLYMDQHAFAALNRRLAGVVRAVIGYPWRPGLRPAWRTSDAVTLARGIWRDRGWDRTPILADALQDAGCDDESALAHLRDTTADRSCGCWTVLDVILPPSPI